MAQQQFQYANNTNNDFNEIKQNFSIIILKVSLLLVYLMAFSFFIFHYSLLNLIYFLMNKHQPFNLKLTHISKNDLCQQHHILSQTQSALSFIKHNNEKLGSQTKRKISKQIIYIKNQQLQKQIELYNWRCNTDLPISKVYSFKILSNKQNSKDKTLIQIFYETPSIRLNQIGKLPLFQILYLFKQSLIGFQRLVNRNGFFQINDNMIFLNKSEKCKVWWNENIYLNSCNKLQNYCNSKTFLLNLYKIFQIHTLSSSTSIQFFFKIKNSLNIGQAILFLDRFVKQRKIIVLNNLKISSSPSKIINNQLKYSKIQPINYLASSAYFSKNNNKLNSSFMKIQSIKYEQQQAEKKLQKSVIPKFLSKKSLQESPSNTTNPQDISKSFQCKSKSYNYLKNLKKSTFTKLDKSKYQVSSTSFDGTNSQITTKCLQNLSSKSNLGSTQSPNKRKNQHKKDFSFKKQSLQKDINAFYDKKTCEWFINNQKQFRQRKYSNQLGLEKKNNCDYKFKGIKITRPVPNKQQVYEQNKIIVLQNSIEANQTASFKNIFQPKQKLNLLGSCGIKSEYKITLNNQNLFTSNKINPRNMGQKKIIFIKTSPQTAQSISRTQKKSKNENQDGLSNLFERNGWKMQIQTLIDNKISIRQSIKDGKQQRSQYLGTTLDFQKLGRLGRTIKESMVPQDEFKTG